MYLEQDSLLRAEVYLTGNAKYLISTNISRHWQDIQQASRSSRWVSKVGNSWKSNQAVKWNQVGLLFVAEF